MALLSGRAAYKKKDGTLALSDRVTWTPLAGGPPPVVLAIANIVNLQQTPDSSPKVMLKIFEKTAEAAEPVPYLFHFNSADARAEANALKDVLSRAIAEIRAKDPSLPRPAAPTASSATNNATDTGGSASAAMTFASAVNTKRESARWFDDNQLKGDVELQQSLMKKDKSLYRTYMDARGAKPPSITDAAFNTQFWSTRTNLLRAHAIEINQEKGTYNVLSTVKPRTVDGALKLNITVEQVQLIFKQHPLVKRIYDENVPKLSESDFWSRFFLSRLSKKLRGERVADIDNPDPIFDKYDESENTKGFQSRITAQHVPHTIDLEANEENQGGFKGGNRKDVEMRPRGNIPIVQTLNSLSSKIMANVAPSDADPEAAKELDAETYQELALRDLQEDAEEHRIRLNVKEQSRFFSEQDTAPSALLEVFAKQVPSDVLFDMTADLETLEVDPATGVDLHKGIGIDDESDSDEEVERRAHVGSRAARIAAEKELEEGINQHRAEKHSQAEEDDVPMGLSPTLFERCTLTNATTVEFQRQFWSAFLSGDPDRAVELQHAAESLRRSRDRIHAVAEDAEKERAEIIRQKKREIREHWERTGKKIRWKVDSVGGGKDAVLMLLSATLNAVDKALGDYERALAAEGLQPTTEG